MKYFFSLVLLLSLATGCKQKILSGKELEDKLKQTMTDHLNKTLRPGTAFTIIDMNYYADKIKKYYICVFDVKVHSGHRDTTGTMKAFISNDFTKVERTQ
jgi:hypothetical protein